MKTPSSTHVIANIRDANCGPEGMNLVRLGGLKPGSPRWFRKLVLEEFGGLFDAPWFDHPSTLGDSLVVEPYGLSHTDLVDLIQFADRQNLDVNVSPTSHHFPTRTLAVYLTRRTC